MRPRPDRILDYREYPILYVDDEPENLRIFELSFRREFAILTASSGEEGLERLNSEPVALVLSDHRMPGMTGVEFLSRVREVDPKTVRILVTAYGDAPTLGNAINSGAIYKFVPKPWQPDEMRVTLRRSIEAYALDREREQLVRELTLLNRVSKSLAKELDLEPLIDLLLASVTEELGYDGAGVLFFDAAEEVLARGHFAPKDSSVSRSLEDLEITGQTAPAFLRRLREGEVVHLGVDDVLSLESPVRRWVTEVAAEEILVVPLMGKERAIGVLAVDNRSGGTPFTGDDVTLLEGLSHQAVVAIENARLVEDLRRSREHVRRADRLGTLGTLAAGLAHEINNPLVSIHTFLSLAPQKREEEDPEFWGDYHALASREVDRIRRLVEIMRTFGREGGEKAVHENFDLGELAEDVAGLLQREAERSRIRLSVERDPRTPKLVAVRDHLHQVCLNLALNALHATPAGGEVSIRTAPDPDREAVCLEVRDSGEGIPEENLARIFDPFFTTKNPDRGSGLGLMICHRLVTDHGGTIEVDSREGQGSSFRVRLPLGPPARAAAGDEALLDPPEGGC
jgi:signal transduction histidine kinase/CheY-like chemotaxis protein